MWFSQSLEFLLPVRVGDVITIQAEVIKKIDRTKTIELSTDIFNQHKALRIHYNILKKIILMTVL